jgi:nicotinamide riboside transporter PnuC
MRSMALIQAIEWIGTIISLASALAISFKKPMKWAMLGFMIADVLLGIVSLHSGLYGLVILYIAYFLISVVGLRQWSKSESS